MTAGAGACGAGRGDGKCDVRPPVDDDGHGPRPPAEPLRELEAVLRANREHVLAYAGRHIPADLRRAIDPHDVLQDVCLEYFRRTGEVDPRDPDHARRLLLTMARNRIANLLAAHRAAKRGGAADRVTELLEQLAVYERTPSRSALAHEVVATVRRSIDRLPPDYARCVRLRHLEQRPVAEVAAMMSRTEGAAHMLIQRALAALRAELLESVGHA